MDILVKILQAMVIICLLGVLLYGTRALKAGKSNNKEEKKRNITIASCCLAAYCVCNLVLWFVENKLV